MPSTVCEHFSFQPAQQPGGEWGRGGGSYCSPTLQGLSEAKGPAQGQWGQQWHHVDLTLVPPVAEPPSSTMATLARPPGEELHPGTEMTPVK